MCAHVLALDIGAAHVALACFQQKRGTIVLEQLERESLDSDPSAEANWTESVARALETVTRRGRFRGEVDLAIPSHLALTRRGQIPRVPVAKRLPVIQFEAAQVVPYPLEDVVWDHAVVADSGHDEELLLMAVKAEPMNALCEAVISAGLRPRRAIPSAVALVRAFRFTQANMTASALLVNIGARSASAILVQGERMHARALPCAGNLLTQAIADDLGISFARAEVIKLRHLAENPAIELDPAISGVVSSAAEQFAGRLQAEITRAVGAGPDHGFGTPEAVFLGGGGARSQLLVASMRRSLSLPVHRFDPLRCVSVGGVCASALQNEDITGTLGLAVACAFAPEANLLPRKLRQAAARRQRQPVIIAVAALIVLALMPPLWSYDRAARRASDQNLAVGERLESARTITQRHGANLAGMAEARSRIEILREVTVARTKWVEFFAEMQRCLSGVEDVWLERVALMPSQTRGENGANEENAHPHLRLRLSGLMLDREHSDAGRALRGVRVERLLTGVRAAWFAHAIEDERFDSAEPGVLRFEFSLVVKPGSLFPAGRAE